MSIAALLAALAILAPSVQDPAPPPDEPCRLFGVLVDDAGRALEGVALSVKGFQANSERAQRFGLPQGWRDPAPITTGADGKFAFSFVPPRAFQFTLSATAPGHGGVGWRWSELEPGKELDLGTTTLEPEAVLVGHILDAEGNLLIEGWTVTAWNGLKGVREGRASVSARSAPDPSTGQFRLAGLPPGVLRVDAVKGPARIENFTVITKKGEVTDVELRYAGPDAGERIVVAIHTGPFHAFKPTPVRCTRSLGTARATH